jgi:hypothetical protein
MGVTIRFDSSYIDNLRWFGVEGYNCQLIPLLLYSVVVQFVTKLRSADLLLFDQLILDQKRPRCKTFQSADFQMTRVAPTMAADLLSADSHLPRVGAIKRGGALKSADFSHLPRVGANKSGGPACNQMISLIHLPLVGANKSDGAEIS